VVAEEFENIGMWLAVWQYAGQPFCSIFGGERFFGGV
jgi:hypothetical protein